MLIKDNRLKVVFDVVQNQLIAGALMAIGFAVEHYKEIITPTYPSSSMFAGLVVVIIGLGLSLWALFDALLSFKKAFSRSKWQFYLASGLTVYLWGFVVTALLLVGAKNAA
jgi:hypothetical protein